MKKVYHSNRVVFPDSVEEAYICVEGGRIIDISKSMIQSESYFDYKDYIIFPGIIDIHNHGYHGWSGKSILTEEIKGLSNILPSIGVTSTLVTTTGWEENEFKMLNTIASFIDEGCTGARIIGIHMEGPFFNPKKHNATPLTEVQRPTLNKVKRYIEEAKGYLKYMTIAPEILGAHEVMDYLTSEGIVIGCGHTEATYSDFLQAKLHGMKTSIHTGNAMKQIDRREVGLLGGALLDRDVYNEIICDFFHLAPEMLQLMFKIKKDFTKFIMISDSDVLSGINAGTYYTFGKNVIITEDGHMYLEDGTIYGSTKNVLYGIQNLAFKLYISLQDISKMCSLNPATLLKIDKDYGSIQIGKYADFLILDKDLNLIKTFVEGNLKYSYGDEIVQNPNFLNVCRRIR